ncbi:MAG: HdeD family acid-resistance protein [Actinomycetota bacterium]
MTKTDTAPGGLTVRRTPWDIVLGILIIIGGLVLLGNVVFATAISVLFLGWTALLSGIVLVVGALFRLKSGGFWSAALGGAILVVLGLFMLRNPLIGALSLTLMAGAMFLASGITRVIIAFQNTQGRWLLVFAGAISIALGLWVLFNIGTATLTLLGTLVGIQTLLEGLTLILIGRLRPPKVS